MATIKNLLVKLGLAFDDSGVSKFTKQLDKCANGVTRLGSSMDKLKTPAVVTGLLAGAGAATSFTAALVPAAGAVLALPAAFAVTQAATATLKVGLSGVSDAMKAMADGDAKKLEEALKKLSPNAQEFVKSSGGLLKNFEPIKRAVQDKLFEGLGKGIGPVAKNLLPTLSKGMQSAATQMNASAKEAFKFGESPMAKGVLKAVFKTTSEVLKEASTAVQPLLKGISKLVIASLPMVKSFALWAIGGIKSAGAFLSSERGASKLKDIVAKASAVLEQLGRIAGNVGKFFLNLFKGATTDSKDMLGTVEKLSAKLATWSSSAKGQQDVAKAFKLLGDVARDMVAILPYLVGPLGAIAKLLVSLPPDVQGVVTKGLALVVVVGLLGSKFGGLISSGIKATSTLVQFGGGLVRGSAALSANATGAAKAGAAIKTFGSWMLSGSKAVLGTTVRLVSQSAAWLANTTRTVACTVASGAATVAQKALAIGIKLVNAAMNMNPISKIILLITAFAAIIVVAYKKNETFRKIVDAVWSTIKSVIGAAWTKISGWFSALVRFITVTIPGAWNSFRTKVSSTWDSVAGVISSGWNKVKSLLEKLKTFITVTIPNAFKSGVKNIGSAWDKVAAIAKKPVSFIVNTVYNGGIARIWNWVADKTGLPRLPLITGFAKGGVLPGFSRKDNQIIAARSGEGILVPEAVKALGSDFIHKTNAAARNGGVSGVVKALGGMGDPGNLGIPGFEGGGIVGFVSGFLGKAKDFFINGFMKAARFALNPMIGIARNAIGGTPFGAMLVGAVDKIVNGALDGFKPYENELSGGRGGKAVAAARSRIGTPYSWGGGGPGGPSRGIAQGANTVGFDCSSLMQYSWYKATGKVMPRTTYGQMPWLNKVQQPIPGALGFPHTGHVWMYSTTPGNIIEAPFTGSRVREVPARHAFMKGMPPASFDNGGVWEPGQTGINLSREPEYIFTKRQTRDMANGRGDNITFQVNVPPTSDKAAVGKAVYEALVEYKRRNRGVSI